MTQYPEQQQDGQPGQLGAQPGGQPNHPGGQPSQPGGQPGQLSAQPGGQPNHPGGQPSQPGGQPGQPGAQSGGQPGGQPLFLPPGYPAYPAGPTAAAALPARPNFPHDRPRPYHQMLRTWTYASWKSMVGIAALLLGFVIVVPVLALPVLFVGVAFQSGDYWHNVTDAASLETITPAAMLYLNATLGGMILLTWLIIRVLHGMRPRWLASVQPRLRWNFLFVCLGLSAIALILSLVVSSVLPATSDDTNLTGGLNHFSASSALIALIVLLTTPFQSAGEEYVFRGYLLMAVGSFIEKPWGRWFTIVLTALIFACAHLQFDPPVFFDRFAFGMVAAWLAIRTGGLEAGIALHILNNYLAFGFALAFGDITETLSDPQASWWNILVTLTQSLSYALLVARVAKRMQVQQLTRPPTPGLELRQPA